MAKQRPLPRHTLAKNLRLLMETVQLSEREIAKRAKVDPKTVNNQVNGRYSPDAEKADAVAKVFGLQGWQLLDPAFDVKRAMNEKLQELFELYDAADDAGRENILRVAEMAAGYRKP